MMLMGTQGPAAFYAMTIIFTILNCVVVSVRLYQRRKMQKQSLKLDDWLTIPALILNIIMAAIIWVGVSKQAIGYPTPPVTQVNQARRLGARTPLDQVSATVSMNQELGFVIMCLFPVSVSLSKASILLFYRRIFCSVTKWYEVTNLIISFMLVIVVMFALGVSFSLAFACGTRFNYWWSSAGAQLKANCADTQMITYAHSVSDFIIDVIIIAIPIPLVWKLNLTTKRKIGVIAVFLTASVAVVASLIKMAWFLWENETPWNPSFDQLELASTLFFWEMLETEVALLAACLPTLKQFFIGSKSLDSVFRSLRTTLSLSSLKSVKSQTGKRRLSKDDNSLASESGKTSRHSIPTRGGED